MPESPDKQGPSLRRVLTLYLSRRAPVALVIDGLLLLVVYSLLYLVWGAFPQPGYPSAALGEESLFGNLFEAVTWFGPLSHLVWYAAWVVIAFGFLRELTDRLRPVALEDSGKGAL